LDILAAIGRILGLAFILCQQNRQQNTLTERNAMELSREQNVLEFGQRRLYRTQWNGMERSAAVL